MNEQVITESDHLVKNNLTKREMIAMAAMQGMLSHENIGECTYDEIAELSVLQADALIRALNDISIKLKSKHI